LNTQYYIESYCKVKDASVTLNDKLVFEDVTNEPKSFFKSAYKNLELKYSKFFKMDNLSKLSFLAAEYLFHDNDKIANSNTAIVLSNRASSLDTDRKHQSSIQDKENYYPSPAIFVYTLPNIAIGEISIRHQLKSENAFFVFDTFNADFLCNYAAVLLDKNKAESVLCGWVDVDNEHYEGFLYLVSRKGKLKHNVKELTNIYQN